MAELGLLGIQLPETYGGSAMSAVDYCLAIEELARVCPAVALSVAAHNGLCSAHIAMFGTEAQKTALPAAAGQGRDARRVGADRAVGRAATPPAPAPWPSATATAGC